MASLASTLSDISLLLETSAEASPSHNISTVLKKRLLAYYYGRNDNDALQRLESLSSRDEFELLTAQEALSVVQRVQGIVEVEEDNEREEPPLLGTRDLAKLRTLLSIAVEWGLVPLYSQVSKVWIESSTEVGSSENAAAHGEAYRRLSELTTTFLSLVFPDGAQGRISQTLITSSILSRHASDLLLPAVALGWPPEGMSTGSASVIHIFRPLAVRLMKLLSASQAISALTGIISSSPPLHIRNACTSLLTKQLLRPDGVDGLCRAMFSEKESTGDEAQLDQLEQIARILNSVPSSLESREYYSTIFPRVLRVLTGSSQTSHRRAAAFAIYRALVPKKVTKTSSEATHTIRRLLHEPFLHHSTSSEESSVSLNRPKAALDAIVTLVGNAEPSPTFISKLLSPIIVSLYGLSYDLSHYKTVDPHLRESVLGLLKSWAKIVDECEGEQILLLVIEGGKNWDWKFDSEGRFWKVSRQGQQQPALLLPQNLKTTEATAEDSDLNLFDFFPDPVHLVETLKAFDRGDVASSLFVKLFERYLAMKGQPDQDPMKVFHILQIIVQMQQGLSEGTTSNILRRPDKLFPFVHRVLLSVNTQTTNNKGDGVLEGDSDDEEEGPNTIGPDHDLIETTISLLLSVLEADETVSVAKYPILEAISSVLEPLALRGPSNLRSVAREAKLVLTARLAQTSDHCDPKNNVDRNAQEVYQRALKLLQDPMLPVRAHGLLLLRELLSSSRKRDQATLALVPSILSIFLQAVQDDDSYVFLNGVQGLAMLADRFGKEIMQGLLRDYTGNLQGLGSSNVTSHDVEVRTRIGEALSSVIKRCGSALGLYVDLLVPPLLAIIRNSDIPTVLRTSSISLLADCVDTWPTALLPYLQDLCFGFIDLLQVETFAAKNVPPQKGGKSGDSVSPLATMDGDPTLKDSRTPALRRSAIHFLGSYIRATTKSIYDDRDVSATTTIPKSLVQKASLTLDYISSTDDDTRVRIMAKEAKENLEDLQRAVLGLF